MSRFIILLLILAPSAVAQQVVSIGSTVFIGSGLNDATSGGAFVCAANGQVSGNLFYTITVTSGSPDTFSWTQGGTSGGPTNIVAGAANSLTCGVTVRFAASTGHHTGDQWTIITSASSSSRGVNFVQQGRGALFRTVEDKSRDIVNISDFGAHLDGVTDDTAAWQSAIKALLQPPWVGGTIMMPNHVTSVTTTGIVISMATGQYLRIVGQGNDSVIQCTGVACVTWTGSDAEGSGMSDLRISDPVGNAATIGLYLNGVSLSHVNSNMRFSNMRIMGNSNLQSGGRFAGLGIGVKLNYTTLARFDNVQVQYFQTGALDAAGFNSSIWAQSYLANNGDKGWDIEAPGDMWAIQSDFESNRNTGIYMATGAGSVAVAQSHFEDNPTQAEMATGQLTSSANNYEGGVILVDSGSAFVSTGMDNFNGATTITNNSGGGSSGLLGATVENALFGPASITGTGCSLYVAKGNKTLFGSGCSTISLTNTGFASYNSDNTNSISVNTTGGATQALVLHDLDTSGTFAPIEWTSAIPSLSACAPLFGWSPVSGFDFQPSCNPAGSTSIFNVRNVAGASLFSGTLGGIWNWAGGSVLEIGGTPIVTNGISALTGDVTATGPGSAVATLAASGVSAGTYPSVTVNSKGLVTSGNGNVVATNFHLSPTSSAPSCAGAGDIGNFWVDNTSSVTTHLKVCAEVASTPTFVVVF